MSRRVEIRTWSRDDVRCHLEGPMRNVTVLVRDKDKLSRVSLTEALYRHKIDGNALLDLKEQDLMQWIGVCEVGVAKTLLRTVDALVAEKLPSVLKRPSSAPLRNTIRYSSLDPFEGWDSSVGLHPKRNTLFRVSTRRPQEEQPVQKQSTTQTSATNEPRSSNASTWTERVVESSSESLCEVAETFRLGPLEKERRLAESRAMFDVLKSVQIVTLGWLVDCAAASLELENSVLPHLVMRCYKAVACAREARCTRPWSASRIPQLTQPKLPMQETLGNAKALVLSRGDFISSIDTICEQQPPAGFDTLFQFLSRKFGSDYIERCRRSNAIRSLYQLLEGHASTEAANALVEAACGNKALKASSLPLSDNSSVGISLSNFCDYFETVLRGVNAEEFDQRILLASVAASKLVEESRPGGKRGHLKLLSEDELHAIVSSSRATQMVLLLSCTINPTSFMEKYFLELKGKQSQMIACRQKHLVVLAVSGDDSLMSTIQSISSLGLERGQWILAVCASSPNNGLLNLFLRKLACAITCRPTSSISSQFRVFVHCPVETVDPLVIPQIAQSSSVIVPLLR